MGTFHFSVCIAFMSILNLFLGSCHDFQPNGKKILHSIQVTPTVGQPWPLPQQYISSGEFMTIQPNNFMFLLNRPNCSILQNAVQRYKVLSFLDTCLTEPKRTGNKFPLKTILKSKDNVGSLLNITIQVDSQCEEDPYIDMDEEYLLKINSPDMPGKGLIFSTTVWGALRGLETFSQLVYSLGGGKFAVNSTMILDFPRFSHRGLLLDTSRHYIPKPLLLQNLDAMAYNKLNVFHWHIVDDQSFPYVSKKFPYLSSKGAFNPLTHIYSQADVETVIEYARLRGIRTLVEFDSPGHTLSWGKGQPGLLTSCYSQSKPDGTYGPINPILDSTYTFLESFFQEINNVFPDDYLHLGGDEVSFNCWKTNPSIINFMKKRSFGSNYSKLEGYYMQRLVDIVKGMNKSYIVWQEVFDNGVKLKEDTVVHVWKDPQEQEMASVTSAGYRALLSTCWYLNYINYGNDWTTFYKCDPHNFNGTDAQKRLVLGGEACMWGEFVDGTNVISRTWPRASSVAERLWSDKSVTDANAAAPRLEEHRCRMLKRGLKVQPPNGPGFCKCDYAV